MFKNYLKTAFRNLSRNKIYSFINIAGLSIGLACAMLIVLYVKDEVSYDRFHKGVDQIYHIGMQTINPDKSLGGKDGNTGYFQGPRSMAAVPDIKAFVRVMGAGYDVKKGNEIVFETFLNVDSNFFSVFSFPLLRGNPKTCLLDPASVVLSEKAAIGHFGKEDALGKIIMIKDGDQLKPFRVSAIAKNCPQNSSIQFDYLRPIQVSAADEAKTDNWFSFFLNTFIVLPPQARIADIEVKMKKAYLANAGDAIKAATEKYGPAPDFKYVLQPFTDMHLSTDLPAQNGLSGNSNPVYSYILSGIALFILLIACINFVNLTISRSIKRAREIGVRKVIGGSRGELMVQFLGESFALCFIAFVLALVWVQLILPVFNDISNKALSFSYLLDAKLIAGYIVLFLLTGFLAGFYPALVLSNFNPVSTLYGRFQMAGKNYLQKSLVVLQFSLASFLIMATLTIFAQFNYLISENLGYDDTNLLSVRKSDMTRTEAALLISELRKDPNFMGAAPQSTCCSFTAAEINKDSNISFKYATIDESFFPLMKIPIVEGRNFSSKTPGDSSEYVMVNESFVKKAGWQHPIGQIVNYKYDNNRIYRVVGVVKDYHSRELTTPIGPELYNMNPATNYGQVYFRIRPKTEAASLKHVEQVFKKLFPISPFSYAFVDQENKQAYESEAKWKQMMLFSAIITIFISCIGLFGLSVLSAEKRAKEIGVRKVLGASVPQVVTIIAADFIKLVMISLFISIPLGWIASHKWLQNYVYRIKLDWTLFAYAGLFVIVIAFLTVSNQAIRAALANPVKSLRTE